MPNPLSIRRFPLWFALGWLLATWPAPARAQPSANRAAATADSCLADPACKTLADRGQTEYGAQQNEAALASFRAAYALQPVSWLLFNMARIHQKLGKSDEALAAYRAFLHESQAPDETLQREKARVYVQQLESDLTAQQAAAQALTRPAVPPPEKQPVYKKWWFWTAIGGAAAVVIVGTAVGVAAREPELSGVTQYRLFPMN